MSARRCLWHDAEDATTIGCDFSDSSPCGRCEPCRAAQEACRCGRSIVWRSPNGVDHVVVRGRCVTCGRAHFVGPDADATRSAARGPVVAGPGCPGCGWDGVGPAPLRGGRPIFTAASYPEPIGYEPTVAVHGGPGCINMDDTGDGEVGR